MSHLTEINCSTVLEEIKKEKLKQLQRQNDSKHFNFNKKLYSDSFNFETVDHVKHERFRPFNVPDRSPFLTDFVDVFDRLFPI